MNTLELLTFIENNNNYFSVPFFVDLHIVNNQVLGFYKTRISYKDSNDNLKSYLFPTTFELINGRIKTTMIFGSVERNFEIESGINGTGYGTNLITLGVGNHLYKLLAAVQYISKTDEPEDYLNGFHYKSFIGIIESLNYMDFPFMRITNNESIKECLR